MTTTGTLRSGANWIDVSIPIKTGMLHWPGDPEPTAERISDIDRGAEANVSLLRFTAHTGTHMDGPVHFVAGAAGVDAFPFEAGIGRARLIHLPDVEYAIERRDLEDKGITKGDRLLFKTRNSDAAWEDLEFNQNFVHIGSDAAQFLAEIGVQLVGVDYLSVGAFDRDGPQTHRALLGSGVWVIEGLNLRAVSEGQYEMICLPLRILGCDGSPVRAILKPAAV